MKQYYAYMNNATVEVEQLISFHFETPMHT